MDKFKRVLTSRKFWSLIAALAAIWTGFFLTGAVPLNEAINLTVAALAAYMVGTGLDNSPA